MPNISSLLPGVSLRSLKGYSSSQRKKSQNLWLLLQWKQPMTWDYSVNSLWFQICRASLLQANTKKCAKRVYVSQVPHHFSSVTWERRANTCQSLIMLVFPGESSFASSWPPCLSGLNCLITVIIWPGSRNLAHRRHAGFSECFEKASLQGSLEDEARCPVSDPRAAASHTHAQDCPHAYTVYPLACIWIPCVFRTFRCYHMKRLHVRGSVPSEEGPGGCVTYSWLPRCSASRVSLLHSNPCWLTDRLFAFSYAAVAHPV